MMKKFLALLLCAALMSGCSGSPDASQTAEALCRLYVHGDTAISDILTGWDGEAIKNTIKEDLQEQLSENLEAVGAHILDKDQLEDVTDALLDARKRIPFEVELLESDKESARVKITISSLDLSAADTEAAQSALKAIESEDEESADYIATFVESYLEALQTGLEEAEIDNEENSFEVSFSKQKGLWLPEDMNGFIAQLGQAMRR